MTVRALRTSLLAILLVLPAGCISRNAPDVAYYGLQSMAQLESAVRNQETRDLVLGIGPISIPASLKRSQIVTREDDNRYHFSDLHRWAGLLEEDLALTLGENLSLLLDVETVVYHPWSSLYRPDRRLLVDVIRFDGSRAGEAVLKARWTVTDAEGERPLAHGKSVFRRQAQAGGYAGLVRNQSQLLADLSREIARAIAGTLE